MKRLYLISDVNLQVLKTILCPKREWLDPFLEILAPLLWLQLMPTKQKPR